jgi:amidase
MKDQFIAYDAIELGELIQKREIKPSELLETVIQRIERVNPHINAVIHKMYDQARECAKDNQSNGMFSGVPFLLKDLIAECEKAPFEEGSRSVQGYVSNTFIQNISGQLAMSLPLYWNENNIPIGVQFAGRFGDEGGLFRLAAQLEAERPWAKRTPPIHCSNSK